MRRKGFTLVEILVVLAIVSLLLAIGLPNLQRVTYQRLNATVREFVGRIRSIRNNTILLSQVHRLVLDLDEQKWWVEQRSQQGLLSLGETMLPRLDKDGKYVPSPTFKLSRKYSPKGPQELPVGVKFSGAYQLQMGVVKEGIFFVHFYPNGYHDEVALFLTRERKNSLGYIMELKPPMGKVDVFRENIEDFEKEGR